MLEPKDLALLRALKPVTFDGTVADGFGLIVRNNQRQNVKKGSPRTQLQVYSDSAKGLGFEQVLHDTGLFVQSSPAVEDPDSELDYDVRQRDFLYGPQTIQVKTITKLFGSYAYLTDPMFRSIMKSIDLNDFFIFGLAQIQGSRDAGDTTFTYEPAFAISSECLKYLLKGRVDNGAVIDTMDMYKRPEHYQSIHPKLCASEE